jgi:hypothetical protein
VLIAAGCLPNEVWRMLGIAVAHGLDEGLALVTWVRAVATGLLAEGVLLIPARPVPSGEAWESLGPVSDACMMLLTLLNRPPRACLRPVH